MPFKPITKQISIKAPAFKVWEVLFTDSTYRIWSSVFSEGSYFETDWKVGSKALFTDKEGYGLLGIITENTPQKTMSIEYNGQIAQGVEDFTSQEVLNGVKGATETYNLSESNGVTTLTVDLSVNENWFDMMDEGWGKAIVKIKELSEVWF
jgi:hypothetical protein